MLLTSKMNRYFSSKDKIFRISGVGQGTSRTSADVPNVRMLMKSNCKMMPKVIEKLIKKKRKYEISELKTINRGTQVKKFFTFFNSPKF